MPQAAYGAGLAGSSCVKVTGQCPAGKDKIRECADGLTVSMRGVALNGTDESRVYCPSEVCTCVDCFALLMNLAK